MRIALTEERNLIQARLREIEAALGLASASPSPAPAAPAPRRGRPPKVKPAQPVPAAAADAAVAVAAPAPKRGRPAKSVAPSSPRLTMREAISRALSAGPLRIQQIVAAMLEQKYPFISSKPVNSVGAYLYGPEGKKCFKRKDGLFQIQMK